MRTDQAIWLILENATLESSNPSLNLYRLCKTAYALGTAPKHLPSRQKILDIALRLHLDFPTLPRPSSFSTSLSSLGLWPVNRNRTYICRIMNTILVFLRSCCTSSPSYVFFPFDHSSPEVLGDLNGQQVLFEVPSNMILKRVPPPILLSAMILLQGLWSSPRVAFGISCLINSCR